MSGLRIVLAADEAAGVRTLNLLTRSPHELVGVAARPVDPDDGTSLLARAEALGVPGIDARRLRRADVVPELVALRPDVLLNVHSLTKVCGEVLDVFGVGAWNLHPGPLPEGAGINVPSWAIALGWTEHGVTVHRMTTEYDEGEIAYADRFPIAERATGLTLSAECGSRGLRLVKQLIDQLADDPAGVPRLRQDPARRGYYGLGQPRDGRIDWTRPAAEVDAHVRAADFRPFDSPWPAPCTEVDGRRLALLEVAIGEPTDAAPGTTVADDGRLAVAAADRWVTLIETADVPDRPTDADRR